MPLKWFRRNSNSADERSSTETVDAKHKPKRTKAVTQRSRRSHSHGSGLRGLLGLGGSAQLELDAAAAVAAEEEQRRISYQTKSRRRFTIHGLSYHPHHKHDKDAEWSCNSTPAGSPLPMYSAPSPSHVRHFGFASGRGQQMIPLTPESHPSIIFIDCPP